MKLPLFVCYRPQFSTSRGEQRSFLCGGTVSGVLSLASWNAQSSAETQAAQQAVDCWRRSAFTGPLGTEVVFEQGKKDARPCQLHTPMEHLLTTSKSCRTSGLAAAADQSGIAHGPLCGNARMSTVRATPDVCAGARHRVHGVMLTTRTRAAVRAFVDGALPITNRKAR